MEKAIFDFLWGVNIRPIQGRTVYQSKELGGLGLKNPLLQQQALQLNLLGDTLNEDTNFIWNQLPRYWLGLHLAPLKQAWNFLRHNNIPTTDILNPKPPYYSTLLDILKQLDMSKLPEIRLWSTRIFYQQLIDKSTSGFYILLVCTSSELSTHVETCIQDACFGSTPRHSF